MPRPSLFGSSATALLLGILVSSCASGPPDAGVPADLPVDPEHPWLTCDPVGPQAPVTRTIRGGVADTLMFPGGHSLVVPASALAADETAEITFWQFPGTRVAVQLGSPGQPGVEFADSLTLTLSYAGRGCDVGDDRPLTIYRVRPIPPHEPLPRPARSQARGGVSGRLTHFSAFAIAR